MATEAAARSFDITVSRHSIQDVDELEASFGAIRAAGVDALIALLDPVRLPEVHAFAVDVHTVNESFFTPPCWRPNAAS